MDFSLLTRRNFSLYLFRQSSSIFGMIFLNVSLALYILQLTGSAGKFASILSLGVIPHIVLGPLAGALVDRMNQRKLLMALDSLRGIYLILLFGLSNFFPIGQEFVYVTVLFFATCDLLLTPAYSTLMQQIVKKDDLTQANTINTTVTETIRVLAPLLGTIVYSASGIGMVFFITGLISLASSASAMGMRLPAVPAIIHRSSLIADIGEGLLVFKRDVRITSLVLNGVLTHIFLFPFVMIGFPYMMKEVFGASDVDFGIAESAQTIGSICSIFAVTYLARRFSISTNIGIGIAGLILAVLPMCLLGFDAFLTLLDKSPLAVVLFYSAISFILYMMFSTYGVFFRTFYQQTIDTAQLGRFVSVMGMSFAIGRLLGFYLYGYLFDSASLLLSVIVLGIGMIAKIFMHIPFVRAEKQLSQQASAE